MNRQDMPSVVPAREPACNATESTIAQLVGRVYEAAPAPERVRLIQHLLRPLGLLALVGVAHGAFARVTLHSPYPGSQIQLEDVLGIGASDVVALVDFVQQVSVEAIDGLVQIVTTSPAMATTVAAELLVLVLMRQLRNRRKGKGGNGNATLALPT